MVWSGKIMMENNLPFLSTNINGESIWDLLLWGNAVQRVRWCCTAMYHPYQLHHTTRKTRSHSVFQTIMSHNLTYGCAYQPYFSWCLGSTRSLTDTMLTSVCIAAFHSCFHIHAQVFIFAEKVTSLKRSLPSCANCWHGRLNRHRECCNYCMQIEAIAWCFHTL